MKLKEELTEKMHSEFTVNEETEQKHRAGCVWGVVGFDASKDKIEEWSKFYGITYDMSMKWRSFWNNLHDNNR